MQIRLSLNQSEFMFKIPIFRSVIMVLLANMISGVGIMVLMWVQLTNYAHADQALQPGSRQLTSLKLGLSFPPVSNAQGRDLTRQHMVALNMSLLRFGEDWTLREPTKGTFAWGGLDDRMQFVQDNNLSLWLTIQSQGPPWACDPLLTNKKSCVYTDLAAFRNYVNKVLKRHGNKIAKIQFGNEWQGEWWYAGTAEQFVASHNVVYSAARLHAPEAKVVLGGFSIGALRGLAACEGLMPSPPGKDCASAEGKQFLGRIRTVLQKAKYDAIDIHLYDDPENWQFYHDAVVKNAPGVPILISEFGGPNVLTEPYTDEYHGKRVQVYLDKIAMMPVAEAYYFTLVENPNANKTHVKSGLLTPGPAYMPKSAYYVVQSFCKP